MGEMDGELEYPTIELEDMTNIGQNFENTNKLTDNYGNTYDRAICNVYGAKGEYLLNMKYSRFRGILYVPEGYTDSRTYYLTIIADGKTIYKSPEMSKSSAPVDIDINVTGCNDLKIEFSYTSYSYYQDYICLGEAGFYQ